MQDIKTRSTASKMLEAALQQMDGIISHATINNNSSSNSSNNVSNNNNNYNNASQNSHSECGSNVDETHSSVNFDCQSQVSSDSITSAAAAVSEAQHNVESTLAYSNMGATIAQVTKLTKELALTLKQLGLTAPAPGDAASACIISEWLERHIPKVDADERMRRLQRDKESMALQYQLLANRVNEQADKIIELEGLLTERTQQLSIKEDMLQRQLLTASALETQKLEFISALSELKLHRAALGREAAELAQAELNYADQSADEHQQQQKRYVFAGSVGNLQHLQSDADAAILTTSITAAGEAYLNNADATNNTTLRYKTHSQFHSLPRVRGSKQLNGNNNHNNKSNIWMQQQQSNEHNNNNNNSSNVNNNNNNNNSNNDHHNNNAKQQLNENNSVDCVCATTKSASNSPQKQRNVVFASYEKIIDDQMPQSNPHLLHYLQQSIPPRSCELLQPTQSPTMRARSAKGFRQIFGKLRRSNSGNLELPALETTDVEFKRGGARATAGGRIEWSSGNANSVTTITPSLSSKAWSDWSPQEICNWLTDLGLGCYEDECRKWLKANPSVDFFTAAVIDIERELNIKMPLHRKKIQFAIDELTGRENDELALSAAQLDVSWVLRWLDDIGLPQYKDTFLHAKLDGRMLHRLTMEDLGHLHVSSCLHIASLRRGIQNMRENHWNPGCLIRRSTKPLPSTAGTEIDNESMQVQAKESIALWTAHRVMEWLRVVDLSEYAPNLRGAGVHGALMLYEPRFNADLLADLLSIPPSKTLLRRHLATHFKELLGRDVITSKRDAEATPGFQPLTITGKLKPTKRAQFSLKRRKSAKAENANCIGLLTGAVGGGNANITNEFEWSSYVCPMLRTSNAIQEEQQKKNNIQNT